MHDELYRRARGVKQDLVRFTQRLVRMPSYSLEEETVADRVESQLEVLAYDLVFRDNAGNVIGIVVGSDEGPVVLLNSHMDTVRPGDEASWTGSPFSGRVKGGRIHGLGASDCKGGLAAQVYAGHVLARSVLSLHGTLVVAATVAEENGCSVGTRYLLEKTLPKLGLRPSMAILGEPTSLGLCVGHDGWVDVDAEIEGGDELTVRRAAEMIINHLRCSPGEKGLQGPFPGMQVSEPEYSDNNGRIRGLIRIRRRVRRGEDADECVQWVRRRATAAAEFLGGASVDVHGHHERQRMYTGATAEVECQSDPWGLDVKEPLAERAREVLIDAGWKEVPVRTWRLERLGMGTAGSLLVDEWHIPTFGFGPGEEQLAHAPDESVKIASLIDAVFGTSVLVHDLLESARFGWAVAP